MRPIKRAPKRCLAHHQEADQREGECKCKAVGEAFDLDWGISPPANCAADEAHDETRDYRANQETDSVELRGMHERMRQDENAYDAEDESENSELQDCERRIGYAERQAEKRHERNRRCALDLKARLSLEAISSRCSVNAGLEDDLDEYFESEFEDEPEQIFHVAAGAGVTRNYERITGSVPAALQLERLLRRHLRDSHNRQWCGLDFGGEGLKCSRLVGVGAAIGFYYFDKAFRPGEGDFVGGVGRPFSVPQGSEARPGAPGSARHIYVVAVHKQ